MTARSDAISDMKYYKSLGEARLKAHYLLWRGATLVVGTYDADYACTIMEIHDKLNTNECLLKEI